MAKAEAGSQALDCQSQISVAKEGPAAPALVQVLAAQVLVARAGSAAQVLFHVLEVQVSAAKAGPLKID